MVGSAFALVPLTRYAKARDQLLGIFSMAFRALTLIHVGGRGNLFKLELTVITVKFVQCHTVPILQESHLRASRQKPSCDIAHTGVCML